MQGRANTWEATEHQEAAVRYAQEYDYKYSVPELCESVGIAKQSYYSWFKTPEFLTWWLGESARWRALKLPEVHKVIAEQALAKSKPGDARYDMKAVELYLQRFDEGFVPRSRQDNHNTLDITAELSDADATRRIEAMILQLAPAEQQALPAPADVIDTTCTPATSPIELALHAESDDPAQVEGLEELAR
jgi:hypothetical protein